MDRNSTLELRTLLHRILIYARIVRSNAAEVHHLSHAGAEANRKLRVGERRVFTYLRLLAWRSLNGSFGHFGRHRDEEAGTGRMRHGGLE